MATSKAIQNQLDELTREVARLSGLVPEPKPVPPPAPTVYHRINYNLTVMDLVGGSPFRDERRSFISSMKAAISESEIRSKKRGGWPIIFCSWRDEWSTAVKAKIPEPEGVRGCNANAILIIEELSADDGHGMRVIRDWRSSKVIPDIILSEQKDR